MKALYFDGQNAVYREDYAKPEPGPGESLIRILMGAVCNTDKEVLKGYKPDFAGVMGHEFVGIVEQSQDRRLLNKKVVGELNEGCGTCLYCKSGREKHCETRKVIGLEKKDGCFAQYMTLANHLIHVVPEGLSADMAIYTEPLAAALEIPTMVHIHPDKNIAIIGDGRLALMIAQVLSLSGADLTVIGKHPQKLEKFTPYAKTTFEATGSYEVVVEASGSPQGILLAQRLVRKQGTIVVKSTYAGTVTLDMSYFVVNEIAVVGSRCGPFEPALNLLQKGLIALPPIELYELRDYEKAFASTAFKAGFRLGVDL